jgi:hypothetical protein
MPLFFPRSTYLRCLSTVLQNFVGVGLVVLSLGAARSEAAMTPSQDPFTLEQMNQGWCSPAVRGIPYDSISQTELRTPSLWWVREDIGARPQYGRRLIDRWLSCNTAEGQPDRVDVLVNQQLWSSLDYLDRYELVSRLATAVREQQYNLRVFDPQGQLLASYTCDFSAAIALKAKQPESATGLACNLSLNSGDRGFRSMPSADAPFPTTGGIMSR